MRSLTDSQKVQIQIYGKNVLTPPKRESIFKQFLGKFEDPIIRILVAAAVVTLLFGHFVEGAGVVLAIILATGIGFINEYKSQKNFDILNQSSDDVLYKVIETDGSVVSMAKKDLLHGDVVELQAGEEVPADCCVLTSTDLTVMEDSFTGESKPVKKRPHIKDNNGTDRYPSHMILRGSTVSTGQCTALVINVGDNTEIGKLAIDASIDNGIETPLKKQLNSLADKIGIIGTLIAFITFFALSFKFVTSVSMPLKYMPAFLSVSILSIPIVIPAIWKLFRIFKPTTEDFFEEEMSMLENKWVWASSIVSAIIAYLVGYGFSIEKEAMSHIIKYFMIAITIIVVAVPEGLPMAITLSMAYAMKKMFKEHNLVRKLHACETTGASTVILSDKTGTLTQNKMSVKKVYSYSAAGNTVIDKQVIYNCTADIDTEGNIIGNPTEGALLNYVVKENPSLNYKNERFKTKIIERQLFDSEKKFMSTKVDIDGVEITYYKGAPEVIIKMCNMIAHAKDSDKGFSGMIKLVRETIELSQKLGYRVIATATGFQDIITLTSVIVIEDPVRPDVPDAIKTSLKAGVKPIIVTGDNGDTATTVAKEIGLVNQDETGYHITGGEIKELTDDELSVLLPSIKVVSRAKPEDKKRITKLLQKQGEIVAVTGDGTNDAPALKQSDVGLSMGSGTAVAKEASDIVLINDSFSSFVTAVKWGRSIYKNIQKFLVFQLSINIAALVIAMIGPFINIEMPFTIIQMLWINLIMDTFAALALATEPPHDDVLKEKPRDNNAFIINKKMAINISCFSTLLFLFCFSLLSYFKTDGLTEKELTMFFNYFIFINVFNLLNIRVFGRNVSIFNEISKSKLFLMIFGVIIFVQILMTEIGGSIFRTESLSFVEYIKIISFSASVVLVRELYFWIKKIFK